MWHFSVGALPSCWDFTHGVVLAIVVAGVRIEGPQLHPAKTHLVLGRVKEPTDICSSLKKREINKVCL